jgi:N-acetyl-gamma-glutamyl-phosphate reductase
MMITYAIIGASGYSGAELMRLLTPRSDTRLVRAIARSSAGERVDTLYPSLAGRVDLRYDAFDPALFDGVDLVFVALPSGEAMTIVPEIQHRVGRVIDLGGDFRLPSTALYEKYYKKPHTAPSLLGSAVYGLPELHREKIREATFVANPGCYPTSAILGLLPALTKGVVEPEGIVINSLSGVSGAGRTHTVDYSFTELHDNVRAYKIGNHQHIPEIQSVLAGASGVPVTLSFVPHLIPTARGIYTTIQSDLAKPVGIEEVTALYKEYYADAPFVRVKSTVPQMGSVVYTNYCDIGLFIEPHTQKLIVISTIDNLVKGAAGQAIQNMNLMFGLPEATSL